MKYDELIKKISQRTGLASEIVKKILSEFPIALSHLEDNEKVRTPLGTFVAWPKGKKKILLPTGEEAYRKAETVIRLRPGKALKRKLDDE
tara:strand:+ start:17 stop:286 length:270 start_codon:yes stop_codon:yes gene_type:complete